MGGHVDHRQRRPRAPSLSVATGPSAVDMGRTPVASVPVSPCGCWKSVGKITTVRVVRAILRARTSGFASAPGSVLHQDIGNGSLRT
jgi:hypothetical protein